MVLDVVRMLKSKPTVLMEMHRLEVMRDCGKVVKDGEFEELMESLRGWLGLEW